MLDAAERAAAADDFAAAYDFLQRALHRQEERLGAVHPDLANTLNNLAVVAERTGREKQAEPLYRRAAAIAEAAFPPDHPMVVASRQNLEDFCRARGLSVDAPAVPPAADPVMTSAPEAVPRPAPDIAVPTAPDPVVLQEADRRPLQLDASVPEQHPPPAPSADAAGGIGTDIASFSTPAPPAAPLDQARPNLPTSSRPSQSPSTAGRGSRPLIWLASGVAIVVIAVLLMLRPWSSRDGSTSQPAPAAAQSGTAEPQPSVVSPRGTAAPPTAAVRPPAAPTVPDDRKKATRKPAAASAVTIVTAELCRTFSTRGRNWRCEPVGDSTAPGQIVFYTRLRSARNAAVMHRWYRGSTLRRSVRLTTRANATEGYRTYSRQTVDKGEWRVELRSADGDVLHEQRFVVR
jgi:hypothetical protein